VFGDYMRAFMASPAAAAADGRVFLRRQARRAGDPDAGPGALGGVAISNGLECKISCSNSKVSYVLDTEDVMLRRRRGAAGGAAGAAADGRRRERYGAWLAAREAVLRPGFGAHAATLPEVMAE
jgi:hypothetical protein